MPVSHSTAQAEFVFTETNVTWEHVTNPAGTGGFGAPTGSGIVLLVFVGTIDSENLKDGTATFSGGTVSPQAMTLFHQVTGAGNGHPAAHLFVLSDPVFTGTLGTGSIEVNMSQTATNMNAMSVVVTGVNEVGGPISETPLSFINSHITASGGGVISGTITTNPAFDDLVWDFVVSTAGRPDAHTAGFDQTLADSPLKLNSAGSAKLSVSFRTSLNNGITGMSREEITTLNTIASMIFPLKGNP